MDNFLNMIELAQMTNDRRQPWKISHKIGDIIMIVLVCLLADIDEWEDMEDFANFHLSSFSKYLELPNGVPSHDTMNRVMQMIDPKEMAIIQKQWNELMIQGREKDRLKEIFSIDGKTIRGNRNKNQKPCHIVSAYSNNHGICFGQELVDDKTNEITAIPELLSKLNLKESVITIDAMGTQVEIAKQIIKKKGDYVLALKGNQGTLHKDVVEYFEDNSFLESIKTGENSYVKTVEKAHDQIEIREYFQVNDISWINGKEKWKGLQTIGMVQTTIEKDGETKSDRRFYISSLDIDVDLFHRAVRGHWGVEVMHWHLDVTFREDYNTTINKNAAMNLNILRKFALSILKEFDVGKKVSLRKKRRRISWDFEGFIGEIFSL